jgi:hypothetical protein
VRLWSLHPTYLDARGLVALWREGLLAQAVLKGKTRGYAAHPQLLRFRRASSPMGAIGAYLCAVHDEAARRGYRFAAGKIGRPRVSRRLTVTRGQLDFERRHLLRKLSARDPEWRARLARVKSARAHPLFRVVRGPVAEWEKGAAPKR